jgi:hypothetical protein
MISHGCSSIKHGIPCAWLFAELFTLPSCQFHFARLKSQQCPVAKSAFPSCQLHITNATLSNCQVQIQYVNCLNELHNAPTKKIILGCPMHKLLFWSAEASAQKFRLPLNLFFLGALCPWPPHPHSFPFPSWAFSLSYFFGLDGSLKLGRSPLKIQSTQLTFEHIKSKLEGFEFKFHVFFISIFMNLVHLKPS